MIISLLYSKSGALTTALSEHSMSLVSNGVAQISVNRCGLYLVEVNPIFSEREIDQSEDALADSTLAFRT